MLKEHMCLSTAGVSHFFFLLPWSKIPTNSNLSYKHKPIHILTHIHVTNYDFYIVIFFLTKDCWCFSIQ